MKCIFGFVVLIATASVLAVAQGPEPAPVPPSVRVVPAPPEMPAMPQVMVAQAAPPEVPAPPVPPMNWYAPGKGSYLGIGVQEVDADRAKALHLSEERGAEITMVTGDSPAAKAGLKEGDVVLEFNGQRVEGVEQFVRMVRETPPGRQVRLLISRNGATQTVTATVGGRKQVPGPGPDFERQFGPGSPFQRDLERQLGPGSKFHSDMQRLQQDLGNMDVQVHVGGANPLLGIVAEPVGDQLAEFFGVKQGVLVRSVTKDSAAEKAGIKAGDVITEVAGKPVTRPNEITRNLGEVERDKPVAIAVVREKRQLTMNVTLPPRPDSSRRMRPPRPPRVRQQFLPHVRGRFVSFPANTL